MSNCFNISGSLIQAYFVCQRQVWLLAHKLKGNQDNDLLAIGRFISENSYRRDRKNLKKGSNIIDVIKNENNEIIVIETKKSSRKIKAAKMQLLYYLTLLENTIKITRAQIRIPKEKKIIDVFLDDKSRNEIQKIVENISNIIKNNKPPQAILSKKCYTCSYIDFCWA